MYKVSLTSDAEKHIAKLKKSEPSSYKKTLPLLDDLIEHPTTGTGKPECLKGYNSSVWSRRISDKHRLVYQIEDEQVLVLVISAYGHYLDK